MSKEKKDKPMEKELEVGPEDLAELLRSGAIKSRGYVISLVEDDPSDAEDWADLGKAVAEKIDEISEIESEDELESESELEMEDETEDESGGVSEKDLDEEDDEEVE